MLEIFRPDYRAFEALLAPARPRAQLWRLIVGCIVAISCFVFLSQTVWALFVLPRAPADIEGFVDLLFAGQTPGSVIFMLVQIGLLIPSVLIALALLHGRGLLSLFGPIQPFLRQFGAVLAVQLALLAALAILPPYGGDLSGTPGLEFERWLILLPLSLACVLLQCTAEEYAFRGYLQQYLGARFSHPIVWMLIPAALFGWGHYIPDEAGENALFIAALAAVFGLAMSDLTARAGTLGPAIAVHLVNNISAILLLAPGGSLSGLALFVLPFGLDDADALRPWLWIDLMAIFTSWLAARLVLRR